MKIWLSASHEANGLPGKMEAVNLFFLISFSTSIFLFVNFLGRGWVDSEKPSVLTSFVKRPSFVSYP